MIVKTGVKVSDEDFEKFCKALNYVCTTLARQIARDGEGATKLVEINVEGAGSADDAYKAACSIAKSPLVKTALFGEDANWGRIITAVGYSGADFNPENVDIFIGDVMVCKGGAALPFDEEKAAQVLKNSEINLLVRLNKGIFSDRMWTCDFSYDYVKINASYRS
jgi:glutamate N-acetyltransferase/amino-acid N-acetyltransferase